MRIRLIPYRRGSVSARLLAQALSRRLHYHVLRSTQPHPRRFNFRWGQPGPNKLRAFQLFEQHGVPHVPFTASREVAERWLAEGSRVLARTVSGQGGAGIDIVNPGSPLPRKPLYTKYVQKKKEFRVHVFNGQVIDVQQKRRRNGVEDGGLIRNLANGWVFCHDNIVEPNGLRDAAVRAVQAMNLQFGAVDVIWNERQNRCYVLEVNTAPGLCETTAEKYANAIVPLIP